MKIRGQFVAIHVNNRTAAMYDDENWAAKLRLKGSLQLQDNGNVDENENWAAKRRLTSDKGASLNSKH